MRSAIDIEAMSKSHQLDIAKPPVKEIPRLDFPKMVYNHAKAAPARVETVVIAGRQQEEHILAVHGQKIVNDEKELKEALKKGYSVEPPNFDPPEAA